MIPPGRVRRPAPAWCRCLLFLAAAALLAAGTAAMAQGVSAATNASPNVSVTIGLPRDARDLDTSVRIVIGMTLLALAPSLVILTTAFTRTVIVLSFLRTALSVQSIVSGQLMTAFSLILTFFIMGPVFDRIQEEAVVPYRAGRLDTEQALGKASAEMKAFMLRQTRAKEMDFFVGLSGLGPMTAEQIPLRVVVPAFVISELRVGFQMGFLLFLPFILIDFVVSVILMSLGLMFLPPATISLPLKILLFVLVDGWVLVVRAIALSFSQ